MLQDQFRAIMQYSIPKELCQNSEKPPSHKASADWFCIKVLYMMLMGILYHQYLFPFPQFLHCFPVFLTMYVLVNLEKK